jgi:hypothetical protein
MTYTNPEVTLLGDASRLIQGSKPGSLESGSIEQLGVVYVECDD